MSIPKDGVKVSDALAQKVYRDFGAEVAGISTNKRGESRVATQKIFAEKSHGESETKEGRKEKKRMEKVKRKKGRGRMGILLNHFLQKVLSFSLCKDCCTT